MAAALLVVTVNASAQFGFKFGYVNSDTKFKSEDTTTSPKAQNGFYAGFAYDIATPLTGLSIRPGLIYTYVGDKSIVAGRAAYEFGISQSKVKDRSHSVGVPIDIKYAYSVNDDFKVYAFAGPRADVGIAYLVTAKESGNKASWDLYTGNVKVKDSNGEEITQELDDTDLFSRFDLRLGLGAGIQYKKVSLEVGYDWGLLNRFKSEYVDDDETLKKSQFVVGLGFLF